MNQIELKALAKINLGLDVLGRRENGYHDVRMVMQSIYLYDEVKIAKKKEPGITLTTNLKFLPTGDGNIAYKAAQLLMDEFDLKEGVQITLNKHIPVAAGLAGGSSNAAAVLFGMNRLFGLRLTQQHIAAFFPHGAGLKSAIRVKKAKVNAPPGTSSHQSGAGTRVSKADDAFQRMQGITVGFLLIAGNNKVFAIQCQVSVLIDDKQGVEQLSHGAPSSICSRRYAAGSAC